MSHIAERWRTLSGAGSAPADPRSIRVIGDRIPWERLGRRGLVACQVEADMARDTPAAESLVGDASMPRRGLALLESVLAGEGAAPLLIVGDDAIAPQLFAALRDLIREGACPPFELHFLDLPRGIGDAALRYAATRLAELDLWLDLFPAGPPLDYEAAAACLARMDEARAVGRLSTEDLHAGYMAARGLDPGVFAQECRSLVDQAASIEAAPGGGERLALSGLMPGDREPVVEAGARGRIVADTLVFERLNGRAAEGAAEAAAFVGHCAERGAARILHFVADGDERAAWHAPMLRRAAGAAGIALEIVPLDARRRRQAPVIVEQSAEPATGEPPPPAGRRSRKALASIADFGRYQREWFASVRAEVAAGAPFAMANANAPQELLRAMEMPFVVNQWWASIAAAKQQSPRYFELLREHGYPDDVESYSSQGLAAAFDGDPDLAPWGGLPRPDFLFAVRSTDATAGIFENWAHETGASLTLYERTSDPRPDICDDWWNRLPHNWDEELEAARLDLMESQMRGVVDLIERTTDRRFDSARFEEIMILVNEQEDWYRRTRDLIAAAPAAPVGVVDTMPATMVPQWHRGTLWACNAARTFHDEVAGLVEAGASVCPDERVRLMWIGRGLWSNMAFYQKWEESHGAVFVWSMYLSLAADGYIREFGPQGSAMRALAARFVTMGDELRMPRWAGAWHVHEARTHRVDGAVALADADPFVLRALSRAGIPVLELGVDNFNQTGDDAAAIDARMQAFIEGLK
jgi:benzoyl-CoA reductase/2-hydroxyglutaryl-CoA dehydratase subunit BcrC/BadD/HgdB